MLSTHQRSILGSITCFVVVYFIANKYSKLYDDNDDVELKDIVVSSYSVPMCNSQGKCGENPSHPSPRTTFSTTSVEQQLTWFKVHENLIKAAQNYNSVITLKTGTRRKFIFIGDSITESFIGTSYGESTAPRLHGVSQVFNMFCNKNNINPLVLAISGDQTQHLLYRLAHGEMTLSMKKASDITFVLHIGTNNIGAGFLPHDVALGIITVANYILKETKGKLIIISMLPRGDGEVKLVKLCPPRCSANGDPYVSFLPALLKVNSLIKNWFDETSSLPSIHDKTRVQLIVNMWDLFLDHPSLTPSSSSSEKVIGPLVEDMTDTSEVDIDLMPDKLHPNAEGHSLFLNELSKYI